MSLKKKEIKSTICRKLKKNSIKKTNIFLLNSNFYSLSVKYNYVMYFLKCYNIKLNVKLISSLFREELGFIFSFNNFIIFFFKKIY